MKKKTLKLDKENKWFIYRDTEGRKEEWPKIAHWKKTREKTVE